MSSTRLVQKYFIVITLLGNIQVGCYTKWFIFVPASGILLSQGSFRARGSLCPSFGLAMPYWRWIPWEGRTPQQLTGRHKSSLLAYASSWSHSVVSWWMLFMTDPACLDSIPSKFCFQKPRLYEQAQVNGYCTFQLWKCATWWANIISPNQS